MEACTLALDRRRLTRTGRRFAARMRGHQAFLFPLRRPAAIYGSLTVRSSCRNRGGRILGNMSAFSTEALRPACPCHLCSRDSRRAAVTIPALPGSGAVLLVCPREFDAETALAVAAEVRRTRPDLLFVLPATSGGQAGLEEKCVLVHPRLGIASQGNYRGLRRAALWLRGGGVLITFSGEAAALAPPRLPKRLRAYVVPVAGNESEAGGRAPGWGRSRRGPLRLVPRPAAAV